jgi:hypothetical protein
VDIEGRVAMSGYVNVRDHIDEKIGDDWHPAFKAAIDEARVNNRRGVFVPADSTDYTVNRPGIHSPSIDLRNLTNFTLLGEGDGSRIRLVGSGSAASWSMILVGGDSTDLTVRGLYLDGDRSHITDMDPGQHTHTIQVGGGSPPGFAHRIRILDCSMTDMDGDGVAIIGLAEEFGSGHDVSALDIIGCTFLKCGRSGVSNQRGVEFVRIHNCHFEGTSDQDIDFEPTGAVLNTGPRRYSITGNTFIHTTKPTAVTLSGVAGDIPARDNVFANNRLYGGRVGMVDTEHVLIFGNYIESGREHGEPVLQLQGRTEGASISHNHIVRVEGALPGKTLSIVSRLWSVDLKGFDHTTDTITVTSRAGVTGTGPVTLTTSGALPTGLSSAVGYFLIRIDAHTLQLALSPADATAGTAVSFQDNGAGRHELNLPGETMKLRGVDHTTDSITLPSHARVTGAGPVRLTTAGVLPTGFSLLLTYWLIRVNDDIVKLARTRADAVAGMAVAFSDDGTGVLTLSLVDHPRDVVVAHNQLHSHTGADGDACSVLLSNGEDCTITHNEIRSHVDDPIKAGIRMLASDLIGERTDDGLDELGQPVEPLRLTADWIISDNRIRGDAGGGSYTAGIVVSPRGVAVSSIKLNGNVFRGCDNQIRWDVGEHGSYEDIPMARANSGDGTDFANLVNVAAICVGGNAGSQADYIYSADGSPPFHAADGSTARRRTAGTAGQTVYVREAGVWNAVLTHQDP